MIVVILVTLFAAAEGFLNGGDGSLIFSNWLEIGKVTVGSCDLRQFGIEDSFN